MYSGSLGPGQFITPRPTTILRLFSGSTNGLVPACRAAPHTHESDEWYNFVGDGLYVYRCRRQRCSQQFHCIHRG